jgi:hypothetical protein
MCSELALETGESLKVTTNKINRKLGIMLQLGFLYAVSITDGAIVSWTMQDIFTFVQLPPLLGQRTFVDFGCYAVIYKYFYLSDYQ